MSMCLLSYSTIEYIYIYIYVCVWVCVGMEDEEKKKKKRKKVSFADDVMEPAGNSEEYRRKNWKSKLEDGGRRISQKSQLL